MSAARRVPRHESVQRGRAVAAQREAQSTGLVVIGCSLGGLRALETILRALPASFAVPVAIVQHRHAASTETLSSFLQRFCPLPVADAEDMQPIEGGRVYLAPANYHLLVEGRFFRLSADEAVHYSRPSVDVLFESAADAYGQEVLALILTGANEDGAAGAERVRKMGGKVVAQDPAEAEAPAMPAGAIARGAVDQVLRLSEIAKLLSERTEVTAG